MLPTITIVGRPNVGKSSLFNALTRTRDALVADQSGLTRDRKIGKGRVGGRDYWLIDTGGLGEDGDTILEHITEQALLAVKEADCVLFIVDGRAGLTSVDENLCQSLRQFNMPIYLVINKSEGIQHEIISAEFHRLGFKDVFAISAAHQQGITALMENVLSTFPESETTREPEPDGIKVAILGRPNVGKSTLVNRMLGYERVIAYDEPGTTRDSIFIPFERDGQLYTLIDTAGIRRRAKVYGTVEKFSIIKAFNAIEASNVVIMILDAHEGITDQDTNLLGQIIDSGRALIIAVNKWDGVTDPEEIRRNLNRKLHFIDFAKIHFISALHGSGVSNLFKSIQNAWQAANREINTARLNEVLQKAVSSHTPPLVRGRRVKLRYINQGGTNPPRFIIHGNQVKSLPSAYKRYLINLFRTTFKLDGTPIQLEFRQGENPYEGRKNVLTPHQEKKRKRLIQHVKKKTKPRKK